MEQLIIVAEEVGNNILNTTLLAGTRLVVVMLDLIGTLPAFLACIGAVTSCQNVIIAPHFVALANSLPFPSLPLPNPFRCAEMLSLQIELTAVTAELDGRTYTYNDLCYHPIPGEGTRWNRKGVSLVEGEEEVGGELRGRQE